MIYTSCYSRVRKLLDAGIEPIAISRGKPKGWSHRTYDALAPTWKMLKMSDEDYERCYQAILAENDPDEFVEWLGEGDVALLCWEGKPEECHRIEVADWLRKAGYAVEEFDAHAGRRVDSPSDQLSLFAGEGSL